MVFTKNLIIYTDGGARGNPGPAAAAFVAIRDGKIVFRKSKYLGKATNNFAEYSGVIMALSWLLKKDRNKDTSGTKIFIDSELVTNQLLGKYKVKSEGLKPLILKIRKLEKDYRKEVNYKSVPRDKNKLADYLVNKLLDEKYLYFTSSKKD